LRNTTAWSLQLVLQKTAMLAECSACWVVQTLSLLGSVCKQVAALVERMAEETHLLSADRQTLQHREVILLELLTGHPPL